MSKLPLILEVMWWGRLFLFSASRALMPDTTVGSVLREIASFLQVMAFCDGCFSGERRDPRAYSRHPPGRRGDAELPGS